MQAPAQLRHEAACALRLRLHSRCHTGTARPRQRQRPRRTRSMAERQSPSVADLHRIRKGAPGQAAARLRGAEEHRARGRARQRASSTVSPRLFERSERSERSELRDGPRARVPQGSRRAAPPASLKRCGLPGRAFAAPTPRGVHEASPTTWTHRCDLPRCAFARPRATLASQPREPLKRSVARPTAAFSCSAGETTTPGRSISRHEAAPTAPPSMHPARSRRRCRSAAAARRTAPCPAPRPTGRSC